MTDTFRCVPGYLGGPTKMAVVGVPRTARVVLKLAATEVI
jgi:hypothetical protein